MTQAQAAVIAAGIAAAVAILGAAASNLVSVFMEQRRSREAERASYVDELRKRTAEAFDGLFRIVQEMEWVTGHAAIAPDEIDPEMIKSYDSEIRSSYARTQGSLAKVAALDVDVYRRARAIFQQVVAREYELAALLLALKQGGAQPSSVQIQQLETHATLVNRMGDELPEKMVEVIQEVASSYSYVGGLHKQRAERSRAT